MKKRFVMLRALLCAGSIAAAAAAAPSVTLSIEVDHETKSTWTGILFDGANGGGLSEAASFASNNKRVARGVFHTVFASTNVSGVNGLLVFSETNHVADIGWIPVTGLTSSGTTASNVFILEIGAGGTSMVFRNMSGGLSGYNGGVVSAMDVWEDNDKILFVGDFGSGLSTTYQDFRIWDIGNAAWDTYTMSLTGYDGYWPQFIELVPPDTFKVTLSTSPAYGFLTDGGGGIQIPWTTDWATWDISLQRWTGYGENP